MGASRSDSENPTIWPGILLLGGSLGLVISLGLLIATESIALLLPILAAGLSVLIGATAVIVEFVPAPARYLLFLCILAVSAGVFFLNLDGLQGLVGMLVLVAVATLVSRTRVTMVSFVVLVSAFAALVLKLD